MNPHRSPHTLPAGRLIINFILTPPYPRIGHRTRPLFVDNRVIDGNLPRWRRFDTTDVPRATLPGFSCNSCASLLSWWRTLILLCCDTRYCRCSSSKSTLSRRSPSSASSSSSSPSSSLSPSSSSWFSSSWSSSSSSVSSTSVYKSSSSTKNLFPKSHTMFIPT